MREITKQSLVFIIATLCAISVNAQTSPVQKKLENYCNTNQKLTHTLVGISVKDVAKDSVLIDVNSEKSMVPASLVKLYTTSAALSNLSSDFTFKTLVGYVGTVNKGELKGNIIVYGGGDPTIDSKFFPKSKGFIDSIVQSIKNAGIMSIDGDIILDCSMYQKEVIPQTWIWEDFGKDYASGVFPLTLYDNIFQITFQSGTAGDTAQIKQITPSQMSSTISTNVTSAQGNNNEPIIEGNPDELTRVVTGVVPANRTSYTVRGAMPSPPDVFGMELKQALFRQNIVKYDQEYIVKYQPVSLEGLDTLVYFQSPKLELIVGITNYYSNNSYSEHIVKYLGHTVKNSGTYKSGTEVVKTNFDSLGVKAKGAVLYDGSGLSRFNSTTANHMTDFLIKEYQQGSDTSAFYRSLPVSGKYGTLRSYDFPSHMIGKITGKTGSMSRVRNMAGYMTTKSGKKVAFCVMLNGFLEEDGDMKNTMLDILETIYTNY